MSRIVDRSLLAAVAAVAAMGGHPAAAQQPGGSTTYPLIAPYIDRSGLITASSLAQTVSAARNRKRLIIQNPCSTATQGITPAESLFINFSTATLASSTGASFEIPTCGSFDSGVGPVSGESVSISGSSGHRFTAKEQ